MATEQTQKTQAAQAAAPKAAPSSPPATNPATTKVAITAATIRAAIAAGNTPAVEFKVGTPAAVGRLEEIHEHCMGLLKGYGVPVQNDPLKDFYATIKCLR